MSELPFHELFPLGQDDTPYRKLTGDYVSTATFDGERVVKIEPEALTLLARAGLCRLRASAAARPSGVSCARSSTTPRPRRTTGSSPSIC